MQQELQRQAEILAEAQVATQHLAQSPQQAAVAAEVMLLVKLEEQVVLAAVVQDQ